MTLSNLLQTIALWPRWLYKRTKVYLRKKPKTLVIGANKTGTTSLNDFPWFVKETITGAVKLNFKNKSTCLFELELTVAYHE